MLEQKIMTYCLPGVPSSTFPLVENGLPLSIGIMEFGVRQKKKRGQLRKKEGLLLGHWESEYASKGVDFYPEVFKVVGDFTSTGLERFRHKESMVDLSIRCVGLPGEVLGYIKDGGMARLSNGLNGEVKSLLRDIEGEKDTRFLYDLATGPPWHDIIDRFRGNISEYFLQSYTLSCCGELGIKAVPNFRILYNDNIYRNGTEVDMLLLFHGDAPFHRLKERLESFPNLVIRTDRETCGRHYLH